MSADLKIIDFHLHLCRSAEEESKVFPRKGWPDHWYWANPERIVSYMDNWNVAYGIQLNIMDTPRMIKSQLRRTGGATEAEIDALKAKMRDRVEKFNTWACELHKAQPRIIPFVFADPVLFGSGVVDEVERCLAIGAKGVKMHPPICMHFPDDARALPIYELCSDRGIPILTDTSARATGPNGEVYGSPVNWRPVLRQFRQLKLVLAHLCGQRWDEQLEMASEFRDEVFWDMSGGLVDDTHPTMSHREMPIEEGSRVFRKIGTDRIFFGSDGPAGRREIPDAVSQLLQLGLTDEENARILYDNAAELLQLPA